MSAYTDREVLVVLLSTVAWWEDGYTFLSCNLAASEADASEVGRLAQVQNAVVVRINDATKALLGETVPFSDDGVARLIRTYRANAIRMWRESVIAEGARILPLKHVFVPSDTIASCIAGDERAEAEHAFETRGSTPVDTRGGSSWRETKEALLRWDMSVTDGRSIERSSWTTPSLPLRATGVTLVQYGP